MIVEYKYRVCWTMTASQQEGQTRLDFHSLELSAMHLLTTLALLAATAAAIPTEPQSGEMNFVAVCYPWMAIWYQ